ncbi:hypothetical protein SRABI111_01943 [Pseudomonas carnis]|nr:hypothetical protein SRABI111_01943 [Pseudomonas carnis]
MALDHRLQGMGKGVQAQAAVEGKLRLQHIGVLTLHGAMLIQDAGLQGCQRVNILHIRRTAGDAGNDALDGSGVQGDQRKHVRRNPGAIGRNAIGRHRHFTPTAQGRSQGGQGRLAEQHFHIRRQAQAAHAPDQADCQQ